MKVSGYEMKAFSNSYLVPTYYFENFSRMIIYRKTFTVAAAAALNIFDTRWFVHKFFPFYVQVLPVSS